MKTIEDMTHDEVIALSDSEIERQIDLHCAEEGVRLLPEMPTPPNAPVAQPDAVCWVVKGIHIANEEDAYRLAELLNSIPILSYRYLRGEYCYSGPQYLEPDTDPVDVRLDRSYWTVAHYEAHKAALESHEREKEAYDKDKAEFSKCFEARKRVSESVWRVVSDARSEESRRRTLRREFAEYKELVHCEEKAFACMVKAGRTGDVSEDRELLGLPEKTGPFKPVGPNTEAIG